MINPSTSFTRTYSQQEKGAARTLTRACQKEYLLPFKLFEDPTVFALNPVQFARWFNLISKRLVKPMKAFSRLRNLVQAVVQKKWQEKYCLVIRQLGIWTPFSAPHFMLEKKEELTGLPSVGGIYYTSEALVTEFNDSPKSTLKTPQELEQLIPLLSDSRLITWENRSEGCFARANLAGQILKHAGIANRIFKLILFGEFKWCWNYHTALAVELEDKRIYIFDLALHPSSSLTVAGWIYKCIKNAAAKKAADFVIGKNGDTLDEEKVTLVEAPLDSYVAASTLEGRIQIKMLNEERREAYISLMGEHLLQEIKFTNS